MTPTVVRLRSAADVVEAIPHLLGFVPAESLVMVGLHGPRQRQTGPTMRLDLPAPEHDAAVAAQLVGLLADPVDQVLVLVYGAEAARAPDLPRRPLVEALGREVRARGASVREALYVTAERWWSYTCGVAACCPAEGTPLAAAGCTAVGTALTVHSGRPYASREELVASVAPQVPDGLPARLRAARAVVLAGPVDTCPAAAQARHRRALAAVAERGEPAEPDAVALLAHVQDLACRDAVVMAVEPTGLEVAVPLWTRLVQWCPSPWDAQPAAVLAVLAHRAGLGVLAEAAVGRALATDPGQSLAGLVAEALDRGLPPSVWDGPESGRRGRRPRAA